LILHKDLYQEIGKQSNYRFGLIHWRVRKKIVTLATWEAEIRRIKVGGQPGEITHKIPSQPTARPVAHALPSQATREAMTGRIIGKKVCETPFQQKKAGHYGAPLSPQLWWEA
jgi:hypothetical protein